MSEIKKTNELNGGSVSVSENVIRTIANIATTEVCGVSSLSGGLVEEVSSIFGKKNYMNGVRIEEDGENLKINLSIIVNYGTNIPDLCQSVQASAKQAVEDMTGLVVSIVNIDVVDVIMSLREKATEK